MRVEGPAEPVRGKWILIGAGRTKTAAVSTHGYPIENRGRVITAVLTVRSGLMAEG